MRITLILFFFFCSTSILYGQIRLISSTGFMNYQGDLKPNSITLSRSKPYFSLGASYSFTDHLAARFSLTAGKIEGQDQYNRDYLKTRNLSFFTGIQEAAVHLDYSILNLQNYKATPYIIGGIGAFHFNPYTYDPQGSMVRLQPLGTEGQDLAAYPDKKSYGLYQFTFCLGGGIRVKLSDAVNLVIEMNQRKTLTDYLDDVSTTYADPNDLLAGRGAKAAELAFRGDELEPAQPFPGKGQQRGTPANKDWYYTFGAGIEINLSDLNFGGRSSRYGYRGPKGKYGCPVLRP